MEISCQALACFDATLIFPNLQLEPVHGLVDRWFDSGDRVVPSPFADATEDFRDVDPWIDPLVWLSLDLEGHNCLGCCQNGSVLMQKLAYEIHCCYSSESVFLHKNSVQILHAHGSQ